MKTTLRKVTASILLVLILALAAAPLTPASAAAAPVTLYPYNTILEATPYYHWTGVAGTAVYKVEIKLGTSTIFNKEYQASAVCTGVDCKVKPAKSLKFNVYQWRVTAIGGAASPLRKFTVSPPNYYNCFTGSKNGWSILSGAWNTDGDHLYSLGLANKFSSIYLLTGQTGTQEKTPWQYSDFVIQSPLRRSGDGESFLAVRMGTSKAGLKNTWYPGYLFGYKNTGVYAVFYADGTGTRQVIRDWTATSAIKKDVFNTLKVIATGSSFKFLINDQLVTSFKDTRRARGYVGYSLYGSGRFEVELIDLKVITAKQAEQ